MFCSEILLDKVIPVDSFEDRGSLLRTFHLRSTDQIFVDSFYLFVYERGVALSTDKEKNFTNYYIPYAELMSYEYGYSYHMVAHHIIEFCRQYIQYYNHWVIVPETELFIRDTECYCLDNKETYGISVVASAIVDSYPTRAYYKDEIDKSNEKSDNAKKNITFKYDPKQLDARRK